MSFTFRASGSRAEVLAELDGANLGGEQLIKLVRGIVAGYTATPLRYTVEIMIAVDPAGEEPPALNVSVSCEYAETATLF